MSTRSAAALCPFITSPAYTGLGSRTGQLLAQKRGVCVCVCVCVGGGSTHLLHMSTRSAAAEDPFITSPAYTGLAWLLSN
jgi:hypothetical protein